MDANKVFSVVEEKKLVPVVKLDRVADAVPLAKALTDGGLPIAEVTFRTDAAEESIKEISAAFPDMLVGAGTIVNLEQAKRAIDAGATFMVTPGCSPKIIEFAKEHNIPIFPGCCTPTEIMMALEYDIAVYKFFPAKQYGGLDTIKALAAPFPQIKFMPTGGVSASNLMEFLAFEKIVACGGSWMAKDTLINEGKFDEITRLTAEAMELIKKG